MIKKVHLIFVFLFLAAITCSTLQFLPALKNNSYTKSELKQKNECKDSEQNSNTEKEQDENTDKDVFESLIPETTSSLILTNSKLFYAHEMLNYFSLSLKVNSPPPKI